MKNRKIVKLGVLFMVLMIAMMPLMSTGTAVEVKGGLNASVGDYVKYNLNAENYMNKMVNGQLGAGEGDFQLNVEKALSEIHFTGREDITVNGTTYHCMIAVQDMEMLATMNGTYQGMNINTDIHMVMEEKHWLNENGATVKTEHVEYMYMNMSMSGSFLGNQSTYQASKSVMETTYDPPMNEINGTVKAGDEWTVSTTATVETTHYIYQNGEWNAQGSMKREARLDVTHYKALGDVDVTTPAGTFHTLQIKSWNSNEEGNYTMIYSTSDGMPVKVEMYSDGELVMSEEATEYHYAQPASGDGDGSDESKDSPGFEAVIAIAAIGMVVMAYSIRRK